MSNKTRIFEFLYKNGSNKYNINQISRLLGISVGSAFKILKQFEKEGCVSANKKNNALLYQISLNETAKNEYNKIGEEKARRAQRRTKIICTIGPSSEKMPIIRKLIDAGMDAARVDVFDYDEKSALGLIKNIREVSDSIPIILDLSKAEIIRPWIMLALKNEVDFIAVSSIKNADGIRKINGLLGYADIKHVIGEKIKVLVNLGNEALGNYGEIIGEAYGIIIDRNSLGKGKKYEMLPIVQKMIIDECNKQGKPAIVSGQILESMAGKKTPETTEIYGAANIIIDGASCIMLSDETKTGDYPLESVETLSRITKGMETGLVKNYGGNVENDFVHSIGKAILEVEKSADIDGILIITSGGYSARMISSRRLKCRVVAATSSRKILRQLNILWGISPLFIRGNLEDISNQEKKEAVMNSLKKGLIKKSDNIAIVASVFHSRSKITNLLEMHNVGEFLDYLQDKDRLKTIEAG